MKLIDKDALVAEIERRIKTNKECMLGLRNLGYYQGKVDALNDTISFLDTLEVKEVDLQEEPKTDWLQELQERLDSLSKEDFEKVMAKYRRYGEEEPVSEDLEDAAEDYCKSTLVGSHYIKKNAFKAGAEWKKNHFLKPADGDDLPEIDREVIALLDNGKVVFAHRPPEYWDGKDIVTGKVTRHYPMIYEGGWNIPYVKYWLDCLMPKEIEL